MKKSFFSKTKEKRMPKISSNAIAFVEKLEFFGKKNDDENFWEKVLENFNQRKN